MITKAKYQEFECVVGENATKLKTTIDFTKVELFSETPEGTEVVVASGIVHNLTTPYAEFKKRFDQITGQLPE